MRIDQRSAAASHPESTPDYIHRAQDQVPAMPNRAGAPIVDATVQKPAIAGVGKLRQKQQELHGAPLNLATSQVRKTASAIRSPRIARAGVRHRASGHEDIPRRTGPLMQLRLEGASVA
jgi:hypothetical protein